MCNRLVRPSSCELRMGTAGQSSTRCLNTRARSPATMAHRPPLSPLPVQTGDASLREAYLEGEMEALGQAAKEIPAGSAMGAYLQEIRASGAAPGRGAGLGKLCSLRSALNRALCAAWCAAPSLRACKLLQLLNAAPQMHVLVPYSFVLVTFAGPPEADLDAAVAVGYHALTPRHLLITDSPRSHCPAPSPKCRPSGGRPGCSSGLPRPGAPARHHQQRRRGGRGAGADAAQAAGHPRGGLNFPGGASLAVQLEEAPTALGAACSILKQHHIAPCTPFLSSPPPCSTWWA